METMTARSMRAYVASCLKVRRELAYQTLDKPLPFCVFLLGSRRLPQPLRRLLPLHPHLLPPGRSAAHPFRRPELPPAEHLGLGEHLQPRVLAPSHPHAARRSASAWPWVRLPRTTIPTIAVPRRFSNSLTYSRS